MCFDVLSSHTSLCVDVYQPAKEVLQQTRPQARLGCPGTKEATPYVDVWRALRPNDEGYTFWSYKFQGKAKNRGWRLDYFVVNQSCFPHIVKIFRRPQLHGTSDHVPLGIITDLPKLTPTAGASQPAASVKPAGKSKPEPTKRQRSVKDFFGKKK